MAMSIADPANVLAWEDAAAPVRFATVLRERTAAVHREAERSGFFADLIRARATRAGYALLLRNLEPVYAAMEGALSRSSDGLVRVFADHRLRRLDSLQADLRAIAGADWASAVAVLAPARDYADAVAVTHADRRLIAHAYARYLGDLSGGQILKPILARTLGLTPDALRFYDFPAIADLSAQKAAIRDALDEIDAADPVAEVIVGEAVAAFRHNIAVSLAVQAELV